MADIEIYRTEYMNTLFSMQGKKIIKVITGVRRCGKSTLMDMFSRFLVARGADIGQIVYLNFEDMDYAHLKEKNALYQYLTQKLQRGKITYVFLDEIQLVKDFPEVVDSLYIKKNVDIYLTGSNAMMLSGEIATLLSGRYIEVKMLPLSFKEYTSGLSDSMDLTEKYRRYLSTGSFPYILDLDNDKTLIDSYLQNVYNTIILKDVVSRGKISDVMILEDIIRFVVDNIGSLISSKSIADTLTSNGRKVDPKTVEKYLTILTDSYLFYKVGRYDIKGKQYLKSLAKYYVVDIGFRRVLLGSKATDVGHILENIVYLELIRRGYKVYIGNTENGEVDFVAETTKGLMYYQVTASLNNASIKEREFASISGIKDHYPKTILTLDNNPDAEENGIIIKNAMHWLLGD